MQKFLVLIFGIILFFSCSNPAEKNSEEYVAGEVLFKVVDSVDFDNFYAFVKCFTDLEIKKINSFVYNSSLPEDSSEFIQLKLNIPYIKSYQLTFPVDSNSSQINFILQDFKSENENSWKQLKSELFLTHHYYGFQVGSLKVPEGEEKQWVNILSESNIFEWVDVNAMRHTCSKN